MRRSRRLTRAQTLPRVRNAALDRRDFSNGPPLLAATPHAHRRGSEKVQEAGCHAREPGWLRRARRPARCTRPTSRFPGALSLLPSGTVEATPEDVQTEGHRGPRQEGGRPRPAAGGSWELAHGLTRRREAQAAATQGRPVANRCRADV